MVSVYSRWSGSDGDVCHPSAYAREVGVGVDFHAGLVDMILCEMTVARRGVLSIHAEKKFEVRIAFRRVGS